MTVLRFDICERVGNAMEHFRRRFLLATIFFLEITLLHHLQGVLRERFVNALRFDLGRDVLWGLLHYAHGCFGDGLVRVRTFSFWVPSLYKNSAQKIRSKLSPKTPKTTRGWTKFKDWVATRAFTSRVVRFAGTCHHLAIGSPSFGQFATLIQTSFIRKTSLGS